MEKKNKFCQSCMMPMKKDPAGGGTNTDGSKSELYCSYCYQHGAFTQPDMTAEQMRTFVVDQMSKMGMPKFLARFMTKNMRNLKRWKKA